MAYLVLALGAFLSIGGALSIFHGAGIVEVERGWTGVIAGATALTGGIVTIALGLILKTLLDLRPLLATRSAAHSLPIGAEIAPHFEDRDILEPALAPVAEPTSLMTAELESDMLAAILAPTEPAIETARPFGAPAERPKVRSLPVADAFEPSRRDRVTPAHDSAPAHPAAEVDAAELSPPQHEPVAEKSRFKINFKRQPPASLPPEPIPIVAEPAAPAMDDWLDRAFSALDNESPLGAPVAPRHQPEDASAHEETLVHPKPVAAEAAPEPMHEVHEPEPIQHEPSPPPPVATSAVIGRYEADGTSYVMYADGSIEAQSEAGVYRFNSMTELKAFIENAET